MGRRRKQELIRFWRCRLSLVLVVVVVVCETAPVDGFSPALAPRLSSPLLWGRNWSHKLQAMTKRETDAGMPSMENSNNNNNNDAEMSLVFLRHGKSTANELFDKPGNQWGDATFTDDAAHRDAPLSDVGRQQVLESCFLLPNGLSWSNVDLVVVSPLTRALQTFQLGVAPHLDPQKVPIVAHPWAAERVYTASDTGRPVTELQREFIEEIDFSLVGAEILDNDNDNDDKTTRTPRRSPNQWWWFHPLENDQNYVEWRPHDQGQYYACAGEPQEDFHHRMCKFRQWLGRQGERKQQKKEAKNQSTIVLVVTHWAVIQWFTGRENVENCGFAVTSLGVRQKQPPRKTNK